jgi:hypothetical protein
VTPVAPVGAGNPDPLDLDAAEQLQHNEDARLQLVRARAEKWIAGVGALTAVLATALVIKGPDDATQITLGWRIATAAAIAIAAAIALLALATYRAYQAAFGQPDTLREIKTIPLTGLHNRLTQARRDAADDALRDLGAAVRAVFAAIALIAAAVATTWFAPTDTTAKSAGSVCIYARGQLVARLSASIIAVKDIAVGTTIKPCP